ncbi:MAG: DUF1570 domain-containing protein, partial [Phycisphaerales bacterium]|nr:DUF1570 domain-containing protein [Phycisphaerales bacterium]
MTFGIRICAILVALALSRAGMAQKAPEIPNQPNLAFAAFKNRAWSLKEGRIQVVSDIQPENASRTCLRIQSLIRTIDLVFEGMKPRRDTEDLVIWIINGRNDYLSALKVVTGADGSHSSGMATYRGTETNVFVHGLKWNTIQHECWHAANSIFVPDLPSWMDEGIAEVIERGTFVDDTFMVGGMSSNQLGKAKANLSKWWVSLPIFLQRGDQWHQQLKTGSDAGRQQYVQAWSIMQFLLFGDEGAHRHRVNAYMAGMNKGQSERSALHYAIGSDAKSIGNLERSIVRYVQTA